MTPERRAASRAVLSSDGEIAVTHNSVTPNHLSPESFDNSLLIYMR
jgi:hypothetical protein